MTQEFRDLAKHAAHKTAPENFTVANVNEAFVNELKNYCSSIPRFMKNRWDLYEIIMENADDIAPRKLLSVLGRFAEIQTVGQNQKAIFKTSLNASKMRAKKFLTQVGLAGTYESFRLDRKTFELNAHAIGGAVSIDFERMLDGADTLAELMDVITEGLADSVFLEVQKALKAAVNAIGVPAANRVSASSFDAEAMFKLCTVVGAYGGAVIFAPPEFVSAMGPDAIVPGFVYPAASTTPQSGMQGIYSPDDIESIHTTGYIHLFRGTPIVQIPQSFVDENNDKTWIDPQLAYILPTGGEKVVKVVFEGKTQMYDWVNKDNSMEIQVYKKMGCAILNYNNWAIYQNTGIPQTEYNPYPNL